jgi:hypothetical protein
METSTLDFPPFFWETILLQLVCIYAVLNILKNTFISFIHFKLKSVKLVLVVFLDWSEVEDLGFEEFFARVLNRTEEFVERI